MARTYAQMSFEGCVFFCSVMFNQTPPDTIFVFFPLFPRKLCLFGPVRERGKFADSFWVLGGYEYLRARTERMTRQSAPNVGTGHHVEEQIASLPAAPVPVCRVAAWAAPILCRGCSSDESDEPSASQPNTLRRWCRETLVSTKKAMYHQQGCW